MKVVLALDRSSASTAVLETVTRRPWPANSYFDIVSVAEPSLLWTTSEIALEAQRQAHQIVADAIARIHVTRRDVGGAVFSGDPKRVLLERARGLGADLLMVGSCEERRRELPFGGVAAAVLRHAPCSVEAVRASGKPNRGGLKILLATDGSTFSEKAAQWIAAPRLAGRDGSLRYQRPGTDSAFGQRAVWCRCSTPGCSPLPENKRWAGRKTPSPVRGRSWRCPD